MTDPHNPHQPPQYQPPVFIQAPAPVDTRAWWQKLSGAHVALIAVLGVLGMMCMFCMVSLAPMADKANQ